MRKKRISKQLITQPSISKISFVNESSHINVQFSPKVPETNPSPFNVQAITSHPLYTKHRSLQFFVSLLEEWNRMVKEGGLQSNVQAEYLRMGFIYSSILYLLMAENSIQSLLLQRLESWVKSGEKKDIFKLNILRSKHENDQYEDWKVRRTFKSNMPHMVDQYGRKRFSPNLDRSARHFKLCDSKDEGHIIWKEMVSHRELTENEEIRQMNTRFWKSKGQLEGMACRNYNQRVGEKDKIFGTARTVNITPRNSTSGNNLVFAKEQMEGMKKYRLNFALRGGLSSMNRENSGQSSEMIVRDIIGGGLMEGRLEGKREVVRTKRLTKRRK